MANQLYSNFVLEQQMTDLVNTKLEAKSLMTVDYSLTEHAGLKKTINKYTYTGAVEKLSKGEKNTTKGAVTFTSTDYEVQRYQQTFVYNDMDVMKDPYMLDVATTGAATLMVNDIKQEYFDELAKISNEFTYTGDLTYSVIVDALAEIDKEVEDNLFIIMGLDGRAAIRKDPDFIASKQGEILYTGQFGSISGVPVLFSKLCGAGEVYITKHDAIKFFVKEEGSVEQDHDVETKDNTVVYDRYGFIALVDETYSIKIKKGETRAAAAKTK